MNAIWQAGLTLAVLFSGYAESQNLPSTTEVRKLIQKSKQLNLEVAQVSASLRTGEISRLTVIDQCSAWGRKAKDTGDEVDKLFKIASEMYRKSISSGQVSKMARDSFHSEMSIQNGLNYTIDAATKICFGKNSENLDGELAFLLTSLADLNFEIADLKLND